jgi:hypothetical protein
MSVLVEEGEADKGAYSTHLFFWDNTVFGGVEPPKEGFGTLLVIAP